MVQPNFQNNRYKNLFRIYTNSSIKLLNQTWSVVKAKSRRLAKVFICETTLSKWFSSLGTSSRIFWNQFWNSLRIVLIGSGVQTSLVDGLKDFDTLIPLSSRCLFFIFMHKCNFVAHRNSVTIGGNCRTNPGVRESNCTVGLAVDWQMLFSFSDSILCGRVDSGKPSLISGNKTENSYCFLVNNNWHYR